VRAVPKHAKLESADTHVVVCAAGEDLYIDSGRKRQRIRTDGFAAWPENITGDPRVHASLTAAGLFYAYNVKGSRYPGRVVFVPRSELPR
jgi:hypothetical protein